jgi:hypothetical protein
MGQVSKFLLAFKMGWDLIPSRDEQEYTRAKTRYTNALADYYAQKGTGDGMTAAQRGSAERAEEGLGLRREANERAKRAEARAIEASKGAGKYLPDDSDGDGVREVQTQAIPSAEPAEEDVNAPEAAVDDDSEDDGSVFYNPPPEPGELDDEWGTRAYSSGGAVPAFTQGGMMRHAAGDYPQYAVPPAEFRHYGPHRRRPFHKPGDPYVIEREDDIREGDPRLAPRSEAKDISSKAPTVRRYANGGGVVEDEDMAVPLSPTGSGVPMAPGAQQYAMPPMAMPTEMQERTGMNRSVAPPAAPAAPKPAAIPMGPGATQAAAPAQPVDEEGPGFSYIAALDAVDAADRAIAEEGQRKPRTRALSVESDKPEPPATGEELNQMSSVINAKNPNKMKLSEAQRNMQRLAVGWQAALEQGDVGAAVKLVTALRKSYKAYELGFKKLGEAKLEAGDVDGALGAFLRSYAYVPDGKEVKIQRTKSGKFAYQYIDNVSGEIISKGLMTPGEMLAVATKGKLASEEDLAIAGRDEATAPFEESGAPGGQGATTGGSDPAANPAGSQPSQALTRAEIAKTAADKTKASADAAKIAEGESDDAQRQKNFETTRTDKKAAKVDADKAAAVKQQSYDRNKLLKAMQDANEWTKDNPATPQSRKEYDDLPVGAWVLLPGDETPGVKRGKPQAAPAQ